MAETAYTLNITVRNKIATTTDPETVVNGNNDYTVVFDFDSEWDSLSSKTAMFVYGREEQKYKTVTFTGNSCVMPALYNTGYVLIGVFAGDIKTTTAAYVKCLPCIRDNDSTLDAGGGGTIDTGTNDHSQLINRDIADQHPISAITGLEEALTPLVGTTQTVTPSQVLVAIKAGRDIALQHTDSDYGTFVFSAFNASEQLGIVVSNSIIPQMDGLTGTLLGFVEDAGWIFKATKMATKDDVPTKTSQLTNDSGFLTSHQDISGKQDKSTLEADVAAKGFTKNTGTYSKPAGGIPKSDLAAAVQTSLGKADTALQEHQSLAAYRTSAAQDIIDNGKQDKITSTNKLAYSLISGTPTIPTVPTNVSAFTNDAGYLTFATLPKYEGVVE